MIEVFDDEMLPVMDYPVSFNVNTNSGCLYNKAVMCDDKSKCRTCGWNPLVDSERRPKTRERLRKAGWLIGE